MLSHLTVVELADRLGAYTGRILAELGARVINIGAADNPASMAWNTGKEPLALDPASAADRERLQALVQSADILIQGDGDRLAAQGLDFAVLSGANPGLISVIVAPFAENEVYGAAPASDLTLMAMSGIMHMVGDPDRPPLKLPGEQAYALAGIQGAIGALAALNDRAVSGQGQRVWVSAYQAAVLAGYRDPIVWEWTGRIGQRTGNRLVRGKSGVRQVWPAQDGYVTWTFVDNPPMVRRMVSLMEQDGAAGELSAVDWENTLVADAPQAQIEAWEAIVEAWFLTKSRHDLARLSAKLGLGLSQIDTPADALASPQWAERGFWRRFTDEARGIDAMIPGPLFVSSSGDPG